MTDPRIEAAFEAAWNVPCLLGDPIACHNLDDVCIYETQQENIAAMKAVIRKLVTAALAAADAAAWRPIESAPRDGAYVDLWVIDDDGKGRRFADSYFGPIPHTCGEYVQYCDSYPEEGNFWIDGIFGHEIHGEITHWQPLPATPVVDVGGGNE